MLTGALVLCLASVAEVDAGVVQADRQAEFIKVVDSRWPERDSDDAAKVIGHATDSLLAAFPESYEANWRAARWYFWMADGEGDTTEAARLAERAWHIGEKAVRLDPQRIEGHYFTAVSIGILGQSIGILRALAMWLEGKFNEPLDKVIAMDSTFEGSGPLISKGRYFFKLPWPKRDGKIRGKQEVTPVPRPEHFLNWLQCMRSGETPHASIDAGYQHAVAVLMAVISYETGKRTTYDHAKRAIKTA